MEHKRFLLPSDRERLNNFKESVRKADWKKNARTALTVVIVLGGNGLLLQHISEQDKAIVQLNSNQRVMLSQQMSALDTEFNLVQNACETMKETGGEAKYTDCHELAKQVLEAQITRGEGYEKLMTPNGK